jgi:hypothetical protein
LDGSKTRSSPGLNPEILDFSDINYLTTLSNNNVKIFLYADDTSIIINSPNPYNYQLIMKETFLEISK